MKFKTVATAPLMKKLDGGSWLIARQITGATALFAEDGGGYGLTASARTLDADAIEYIALTVAGGAPNLCVGG